MCGAGGGSRESRARAGVCGVGNWQLGRGFHTLAFSGFSCLFLSFLGLFFSFSFSFLLKQKKSIRKAGEKPEKSRRKDQEKKSAAPPNNERGADG